MQSPGEGRCGHLRSPGPPDQPARGVHLRRDGRAAHRDPLGPPTEARRPVHQPAPRPASAQRVLRRPGQAPGLEELHAHL